jgi:hypothetical protein
LSKGKVVFDKPRNGSGKAPISGADAGRLLTLITFGIVVLLFQEFRPARAFLPPKKRVPVEPAVKGFVPLNREEQKKIDNAIERGVAYLRRIQFVTGHFGDGRPFPMGGELEPWAVGYTALPALALLECGIPALDPAVKNAERFVRQNAPALTRTYEISLALLFLDRLGKNEDRALIRSLTLRLAAGQTHLGGWGYQCPVLSPVQEKKVLKALAALSKKKSDENPKPFPLPRSPGPGRPPERADNSNTQFAILALWTARKRDIPLAYTFAQVERRFRSSQLPGGWGYRMGYHSQLTGGSPYGSGTCMGLLGLAVGRASAGESLEPIPLTERPIDKGISFGLLALGRYMADPTDREVSDMGPQGKLNLYFLWSVERVAVFCNLKTIGGKDWYRWGAELLLRTQNPDGSWMGRGNGGKAPAIDTSMALLFLKRSDLLPALRETLQKRLKITDPFLDNAISPKKSPGEKSNPKGLIEKKSPGEKLEPRNGIEGERPRETSRLTEFPGRREASEKQLTGQSELMIFRASSSVSLHFAEVGRSPANLARSQRSRKSWSRAR